MNRSNSLIWVVLWLTTSALPAATLQPEKPTVRIDLSYFKVATDSSYLMVQVKTRVDRQYEPVEGVIINLFLEEQTKTGMMGNVTTDREGKGVFVLPPKYYRAQDTLSVMQFVARLQNDPNFRDKLTTLEIREASIALEPIETDSTLQLQITLTEKDSAGNYLPVESADIKVMVKRLFSRLAVGEDYNFTDENGQVLINFPIDLPGDAQGSLAIEAGVLENDTYGNVLVSQSLPWGSDELKQPDRFDERNMWSARDKAPIYLLIWPNLMLLSVWGVIAYLILELIRISRDKSMT